MAVTYNHGERRIDLGDNKTLIVESKSEEVYRWNEVSFQVADEQIKIGSYYTSFPGSGWESMNYNKNCVILTSYDPFGSGFTVEVIFDIQLKQIINGTPEELLEYYNNQFGTEATKKTLSKK